MKRTITLILLSIIVGITLLSNHQVEAYVPSVNTTITKKVVEQLPYIWRYSFESYSSKINAGAVDARDVNVTLFYTPSNSSGSLVDEALRAYNDLIAELDAGDISNASYELGRLATYVIYFANPFRSTDLKNSTLASKLESLIIVDDVSNIMIDKSITITDVKASLIGIGNKAIDLAKTLNKTAIMNSRRSDDYVSFVKDVLSYAASILYAILVKAINVHETSSSYKNFIYILSLSFIIAVLIVVANRKKLIKQKSK